jgi:hypothetical protein
VRLGLERAFTRQQLTRCAEVVGNCVFAFVAAAVGVVTGVGTIVGWTATKL